MATQTLDTDTFRVEVQTRLIDTFELMLLLGLRTRQAVWSRVEAGTLPPPIYTRDRTISLWDRNTIALPDGKEG